MVSMAGLKSGLCSMRSEKLCLADVVVWQKLCTGTFLLVLPAETLSYKLPPDITSVPLGKHSKYCMIGQNFVCVFMQRKGWTDIFHFQVLKMRSSRPQLSQLNLKRKSNKTCIDCQLVEGGHRWLSVVVLTVRECALFKQRRDTFLTLYIRSNGGLFVTNLQNVIPSQLTTEIRALPHSTPPSVKRESTWPECCCRVFAAGGLIWTSPLQFHLEYCPCQKDSQSHQQDPMSYVS